MKNKMLSAHGVIDLEQLINNWVSENSVNIISQNMVYNTDNALYVMSLVYEDIKPIQLNS